MNVCELASMPGVPDVAEIVEMLLLRGGAPMPPQYVFDEVASLVLRGELSDVESKEARFAEDWQALFDEQMTRLRAEPGRHTPHEAEFHSMRYTVDVARNLRTLTQATLSALTRGPVAEMTRRVGGKSKAFSLIRSLYFLSVLYLALRMQYDRVRDQQEALEL